MAGVLTADAGDAIARTPGRDCPRCPRLVTFREAARQDVPNWFNAPVPSFGDEAGRLLVVGLAPGLRGANRTGRPFTGDYAGDLLYATLLEAGFATGSYDRRLDDDLALLDTLVTNAVRCVPPENRPQPAEIASCRPFLLQQMQRMPNLAVVVALGRIAHDSVVRALGGRLAAYPFSHGRCHDVTLPGGGAAVLLDSFHCSRYNTSTKLLTPEMFAAIFSDARRRVAAA